MNECAFPSFAVHDGGGSLGRQKEKKRSSDGSVWDVAHKTLTNSSGWILTTAASGL